MAEVIEPPDGVNWTCQVRLKDERLPDVARIERYITGLGVGASLRGAEVTAAGELTASEAEPRLRLPVGEVRLGALQQSLRWNPKEQRARAMSVAERGAFNRLLKEPKGARLRVTGSLSAEPTGGVPVLRVRHYDRLGQGSEP